MRQGRRRSLRMESLSILGSRTFAVLNPLWRPFFVGFDPPGGTAHKCNDCSQKKELGCRAQKGELVQIVGNCMTIQAR